LSIRLNSFDVSLGPGEQALLLRSLSEPDNRAGWSLWDIPPFLGFAGAAVVQGIGKTTLYEADANWFDSRISRELNGENGADHRQERRCDNGQIKEVRLSTWRTYLEAVKST
jgi:hypothetical protein